MRWLELTFRVVLIAGLFAAIAYDVSPWIVIPLGLIAIAATAELAVKPYATNTVDRLLLCCGAVVTAFILLGLGLDLAPWGLTRAAWNTAWLIASVGVLAWRQGGGTHIGRLSVRVSSLSAWIILASLVIAGAVVLSLAGARHSERQPTLAFSVVSESSTAVVVEIQATSITGTYRIRATPSSSKGRKYSSNMLNIVAGSGGEEFQRRVPVNARGVWNIGLESASSGAVVRSLKVNLK